LFYPLFNTMSMHEYAVLPCTVSSIAARSAFHLAQEAAALWRSRVPVNARPSIPTLPRHVKEAERTSTHLIVPNKTSRSTLDARSGPSRETPGRPFSLTSTILHDISSVLETGNAVFQSSLSAVIADFLAIVFTGFPSIICPPRRILPGTSFGATPPFPNTTSTVTS